MNQQNIIDLRCIEESSRVSSLLFGVPLEQVEHIGRTNKGRNISLAFSRARGLAIYLPVAFGLDLVTIGNHYGIDRTAVSHRSGAFQNAIDTEPAARDAARIAGEHLAYTVGFVPRPFHLGRKLAPPWKLDAIWVTEKRKEALHALA